MLALRHRARLIARGVLLPGPDNLSRRFYRGRIARVKSFRAACRVGAPGRACSDPFTAGQASNPIMTRRLRPPATTGAGG